MGIYSSWSSLAYLHHVLVRVAALRCGIHNFKDYIVLGDDVAIASKEVGSAYRDLIRGIGVEIRISKSIVPSNGYSGWEFASQLAVNGTLLSPLPLGLLITGKLTDLLKFIRVICVRRASYILNPNLS